MAKHREALELSSFIKRMFRALERRAADGDLEAVEALAQLREPLAEATRRAGQAAYETGYSYTELAGPLGISRQAARQRFANPAATGDASHELANAK